MIEAFFIEIMQYSLIEEYNKLQPPNQKKVSKFKHSHFIELEALIEKKLKHKDAYAHLKTDLFNKYSGQVLWTTVDAETLRGLYNGAYETVTGDNRIEITFVKLSIFLGYKDWRDFIDKNIHYYAIYDSTSELAIEEKNKLLKLVSEIKKNELDALHALPKLDIKPLERYFLKNSNAHKYVKKFFASKKGLCLDKSVDKYVYRLFDVFIVNCDKTFAAISTDEQINFSWLNQEKMIETLINFGVRSQIYFFSKINDEWKVTDIENSKPLYEFPVSNSTK